MAKRHELRSVLIPKPTYDRGREAAAQQICGHVYQFVTTYRGNLWDLATACYLQGLMDASMMQVQHPGWPLTVSVQDNSAVVEREV